jgi:hypothetical protein
MAVPIADAEAYRIPMVNGIAAARQDPMTTLTEMVAAAVVHSSAFAFSHFGVALDGPQLVLRATPASERVVARSHHKAERLSACPEPQRVPRRVRAITA